MTISVTVAANALQPEIPGGGTWGAGRFWPVGVTIVEVVDNDLTALEAALAFANEARTGLLADTWTPARLAALSDDVVAALNAETGGIAPSDIALSEVTAGTVEDTSTRSTLGRRAYDLLITCPLPIVVEVVS